MPRPCLCDAVPACHLCTIWHRHPDSPAAKAWRGESVAAIRAATQPNPAAASWLAAGPCAHRGELTGEVRDCNTCAGKVPVPVIGCRRHGLCHATIGKSLPGVPCCQTCPDQAAELVPGLVDPLPGPWRQPGPWCDDPAEVARHAAAARRLAATKLPEPPPMGGEGLVTCGGGRYWPGVVVLVRMLREAGSELPVQVWYRGRTEPVNAADVAGLGVELIDADQVAARLGGTRVPRGRPNLGGWEAKLFALAHTSFERCIFLDADAYPVCDLAPLLALARSHGFACWDEPRADNVSWPKVGFAGKPADAPPSIQGGQFGIDRRRCWRELVLAHWACQHSDYYWPAGRAGWPLFGDQDAWRLAFELTGFRPHVIGAAEFRREWGYVCWMDGVSAVEHRCFSKLIPAKLAGEARALRHYAEYLGAADPVGWLTPAEAALLRETCRGRRVVEWGRYRGRSTAVIAAAAEACWSVDRLTAAPAASELAGLGLGGSATLVVGDYTDPDTGPPWRPEVLFVDGEHHAEAVKRDLNLAAAALAPGGVIALHDHGDMNAPAVGPTADAWAKAEGWVVAAKADTLAVFSRA